MEDHGISWNIYGTPVEYHGISCPAQAHMMSQQAPTYTRIHKAMPEIQYFYRPRPTPQKIIQIASDLARKGRNPAVTLPGPLFPQLTMYREYPKKGDLPNDPHRCLKKPLGLPMIEHRTIEP